MWFEKFLDTISRHFPLNPLAGIEEKVAELRPEKIYVENVRSILDVSHRAAVEICETAVRQGVFERGIEVLAPDGAVAWKGENSQDIPPTVAVWMNEDGNHEEVELSTEQLKRITFYRLHENSKANTSFTNV